MTDLNLILADLCRAAGTWELGGWNRMYGCLETVGKPEYLAHRKRVPLESRDDCHALLKRLVEVLGDCYYSATVMTLLDIWTKRPGGGLYRYLVGAPPSDLIRAMHTALPEEMKSADQTV